MREAQCRSDALYRSFRSPWAQLDPFLLDLFARHFPTDSRLLLNYAVAKEDAQVLVSHSVVRKSRERVSNFQSQEQVDVNLGLPRSSSLWLRLSTEEVKLHYSYGEGVFLGPSGHWQPYLSFSSTRKIKNSSFKAGIRQQQGNSYADLRLRYNVGEHRADTFFYAKGGWTGERIRLGGIAAGIRKMQQVFLQKSDLLAAVRVGQGWVGVMLDTDGFRNYRINYSRLGSYFDSLRAVCLLDLSSLRLGLLYEYSIEDSASRKMEAAVQYRGEGRLRRGKLRLSTLWEVGVAAEWEWGQWRAEGGVAWPNVGKSLWPAYCSLGLAYY